MARELDRLPELNDLFARRRQGLLGLLDFEARIQAGRVPIARERGDPLALLERGLGYIEQQVRVLQLDVGMRDADREGETRRLGIHRACARKSESALIGGALLAPEIQFPTERGLQVAERGGAAREGRWNEAILREARAYGIRRQARLWSAGGLAHPGFGERRPGASRGDFERRTIAQTLANEFIELRVAERRPPVSAGPLALPQRRLGERPLGSQAVGSLHRRSGFRPCVLAQSGCQDRKRPARQLPAQIERRAQLRRRRGWSCPRAFMCVASRATDDGTARRPGQ